MADELDDNFFSDDPIGTDETDGIFNDHDDLDEIIIDDDPTASNSPFLITLLGLIGFAVLSFLCLGIYSFANPAAAPTLSAEVIAQETEIAQIVITNEAVATQNFYVTQTLDAREANANATATAIASIPTETPTPTKTPVPPTATPSPTPDEASEDEDGEGETEGAEAADDDDGSAIAGSERTTSENVDGSTTGNDVSGTSGSGSTAAADVDSSAAASPEQLPNTGFSIASTLAMAMGLLIILFGARKMRQPN